MKNIISLVLLWCVLLVSSVQQSQMTIKMLKVKLHEETLPLFDFARDLDVFIKSGVHSEIEIRIVVDQYLDRLANHYYTEYTRRTQSTKNEKRLKMMQSMMVKECEAAMKAAFPKEKQETWDYSPFLQQLIEDIDSDINSKVQYDGQPVFSREESPPLIPLKVQKAFRWLASQSILLLINFIQYEWYRRQNIRAAERRLTEVPEFPLL